MGMEMGAEEADRVGGAAERSAEAARAAESAGTARAAESAETSRPAEGRELAEERGSVADDLLAAFGVPAVKEDAAARDDDAAAKEAAAVSDDDAALGDGIPDQGSAARGGLAADAPELDPAAFFDLLRGPAAGAESAAEGPAAPAPAPAPAGAPAPVPPTMPFGPPPLPQWPAPSFLPPQPPPTRRTLRIVLRWAAALLTTGAVGAGTAFAVTLPRRTDIPGLATKDDGRYVFVAGKPPLAAGATTPRTQNSLRHDADLRQYLLPAPVGAKPDAAYPGASGWYPVKDFLNGLAYADSLTGDLGEYGLRRIAAEGWTTPDGQHTVVELLQFPDNYGASRFDETLATNGLAQVTDRVDTGEVVQFPDLDGTSGHIDIQHYSTVKSDAPKLIAPKEGRSATFTVGDVDVLVITTGPAHMPDAPTEQIVLLQAAMLR